MDEDMAHAQSGQSGQPQARDGGGSLGRRSEAGLRELSLFTGIGGGLLGAMLLGWRTVAAVEYEPYCQRVLCARGGYMADAEDVFGDGSDAHGLADSGPSVPESGNRRGATGAFPVHGDIRTFDARPYRGRVDIVTGGFPCQPHSQAGKRLGGLDDRDLWPDTLRVLRESQAPLGFFENVPGLLTSRDADGFPMFGRILGDLSEAGFDAEWCVLGADDVGAPHRRKRLWILAYRNGDGAGVRRGAVGGAEGATGRDAAVDVPSGCSEVSGGGAELADAASAGLERCAGTGARELFAAEGSGPWWCDPADVAHTAGDGRREGRAESDGRWAESGESGVPLEDVAHPSGIGQPGQGAHGDAGHPASAGEGQGDHALDAGEPGRDEWLAEPYVGRVAHGIPSRVDRLRGLGNAQVPQSMAAAFTALARQAGLT